MKINIFLMITLFLIVQVFNSPGCMEKDSEVTVAITPVSTTYSNIILEKTSAPAITGPVSSETVIAEMASHTPVLNVTSTMPPLSPTPEPYIFVSEYGSEGSGEGQFEWLRGITVDFNNNIYMLDRWQVHKFTCDGTFVTRWGSKGSGEGQFESLWGGIMADFDNNIYVVDFKRVQIFTSNGEFITQWNAKAPFSIAVDSTNKYIYTSTIPCVDKYDWEGNFIERWIVPPDFYANSADPGAIISIAINSANNIIALYCDSIERVKIEDGKMINLGWYYNCSIIEFKPDGHIINKWDNDSNICCSGMALDREDNVYLTDTVHHCVWKFDPEGNCIARWGTRGSGKGEFDRPGGIALDSDGNVYVADSGNHRIQKFAPNPEFKTNN